MDGYHIPLLKGYFTSAGLIMAIGAQNAFVLKQGIMKNQVFLTACSCAVLDALMILVGVCGLGFIFTTNVILMTFAKWGGAAFLFYYGLRSFRSVFRSQSLQLQSGPAVPSLRETIITLLAVSLLNPHAYLDTVVLLGSISSQFEASERPYFAAGAVLSSVIWFFSLCYGARLLKPFFAKEKSWKILDFFVGCTMWAIGVSILFT
jgi:L-lysine exporter family protein LysE/ArgO